VLAFRTSVAHDRSVRTGSLALVLLLAASCAPVAPPRPLVSDWRDRVVYQIVTDRFENGDPSNDALDGVGPVPGDLSRWQGGDFRGITDRLDYLARLGVSAIWISPIVRAVPRMEVGDGYHGYWAADFTELEPRFGTLEELRTLVQRAHALDIAVIVDVVPNHSGRVFAYDLDRDGEADPEDLQPPYLDAPYDAPLLFTENGALFGEDGLLPLAPEHFHRRGVGALGIPIERRYGDFPDGLRDLDTESETVISALIETYAHWAITLDVDGFRIDAVPHVDRPFWPRFAGGLRARLHADGKDRFLLLGEVFDTNAVIADYTGDEGSIDAAFDIPFWEDVVTDVILGGAPPSQARSSLSDARALFRDSGQPGGIGLSPWQARLSIVDSHDLVRVRAGTDPFAADQAIALMFTVDAIPCVYYGTEIELSGGGGHASRERMWDSGFREDAPAYALVHRLIEMRQASIALRRGTLELRLLSEIGGAALDTTVPDAGVIVFERVHEAERVLVALNTHPTHVARARVTTGFPPGTTLADRLFGDARASVAADGSVELEIPPRESQIFFSVP
jgi:alpha-amylase